jgi:hypothetical protein
MMEHSRPQQETAYTLSRLLPNTKEEACRLLVYKDLFRKFLLLLFFFKKRREQNVPLDYERSLDSFLFFRV